MRGHTWRIACIGVALVFAAAGVAAAAAVGPSARAAAHSIVLNLHSGGNLTLKACGITHHYTALRRGERVTFTGDVQPAPGRHIKIKIKIKKCVRGRFVTVAQPHVAGNKAGHFRGALRSPGRGAFFVRAYFYGDRPASQSAKQYLSVR
jgi:hypothetical protein